MEAKAHALQTELYRCFKGINIENIKEDDKEELLKIFRVTENSLIRNHIAMIFSDLEYHKAVPYIIKKVMNENVEDNGTLIYSLQNLDCKGFFLSFIKMICKMDYEGRLMAYELVNKYIGSISKRTATIAWKILEDCRVKLKASINTEKGENSPLHFVEKTQELLLRSNSFSKVT